MTRRERIALNVGYVAGVAACLLSQAVGIWLR